LLPRRSQSTVAGLRPTAGERRPGKSLLHSSIPCAHSLCVTPWSSSCHLIELDHRGLAGTPAADEITRLAHGPDDSGHLRRRSVHRCDRQDLPEPTPPLAGPLSPPVSRVALFFPAGTVCIRGRTSGKKKERSGGFLNCQ
jgi:hypothetical protein